MSHVVWRNNNLFCKCARIQAAREQIAFELALHHIIVYSFFYSFIHEFAEKKLPSTLQFYDHKTSICIKNLSLTGILFEIDDKEFEEFIEYFTLKHAVMSCVYSRLVNIESSTLKSETRCFQVANYNTSRHPVNLMSLLLHQI